MTKLSVGMNARNNVSAKVDPRDYRECMKYEWKADAARFGYQKEEKVRKQTEGKRQPSKRDASIGRRENRNNVISTKKAYAAGLAETIYAIKHSGKVRE